MAASSKQKRTRLERPQGSSPIRSLRKFHESMDKKNVVHVPMEGHNEIDEKKSGIFSQLVHLYWNRNKTPQPPERPLKKWPENITTS